MNAKVVGGLGDRLTVTVICPRLSEVFSPRVSWSHGEKSGIRADTRT